jgi:hypothetical protein
MLWGMEELLDAWIREHLKQKIEWHVKHTAWILLPHYDVRQPKDFFYFTIFDDIYTPIYLLSVIIRLFQNLYFLLSGNTKI